MPTPIQAVLNELLSVPLYDDDLIKMLVRFAISATVVSLLLRFAYFKRSLSKDYMFTFFMLSVVVFFICFTLKKLELELGMAMGLFAIFGVLRYRTNAIPVREMSYLFIVIGIAVINSLSNTKVSWLEVAAANTALAGLPVILESLPLLRQELGEDILYERIDCIRPEQHSELISDLQDRTGLVISRIELGKIDLLRDTVAIRVYYYPQDQPKNSANEIEITRRVRRV